MMVVEVTRAPPAIWQLLDKVVIDPSVRTGLTVHGAPARAMILAIVA